MTAQRITLTSGYVRWRDGTAQPVEVADCERLYIEGIGPVTFTEVLEKGGHLCLIR